MQHHCRSHGAKAAPKWEETKESILDYIVAAVNQTWYV